MAGSLDKQVREWLSTKGYALEYQTLHAFLDAGIEARLSTYCTSSEGKRRELDVVASDSVEDGIDRIEIVCECKYCPYEQPWVMMLSNETNLSDADIWNATPKGFKSRSPDHVAPCFHFDKTRPIAHTLLQALTKSNDKNAKRDIAYESLQKVSNASWDLSNRRHSGVAIPCLVVNGKLFEASFNSQSKEFETKEIQIGRLWWDGSKSGRTLVDVVHSAALEDYVGHARESIQSWKTVLGRIEGKDRMVSIPT